MLATCAFFLATAAFATAAPTPSNDIFYLTTCNSTHGAILYYTTVPANTSTPASSSDYYATAITYPGNTVEATIEDHSFNVQISAGGDAQPVGQQVGRAQYADIATCPDTGYDIFDCYKGDGAAVHEDENPTVGGCYNDFYCTRVSSSWRSA